ncbi:hypothetical protein [Fusobacterium varium]|uniref:hypothetical protein n=1 Tax=Fusobacterium varium TaxID=856 RepID=UPI0022E471C5|nr:hypothetical protein [Fusobacterium varium]
MGKPSIPSLELGRSMDLQVHVMTVEETLRHSAVIDELDDKRRDKLHNIVKWVKDMQKSFINDLQEIYKSTEIERENIKKLLDKQSKFEKQFIKSIDVVLKQELELEAIDDNARQYLINYTADTREKLKDANSEIEKEIIKKRTNI